jgi:lactate racemase
MVSMEISLKYGRKEFPFELRGKVVLPEFSEPAYDIDKSRFEKDLQSHLPAEKEKYRNIAVVVSDKTRLCGYPEYLPWVTEALLANGATPAGITFYIAYGTHPPQTEQESISSYGKSFVEYRFVQHNCKDESVFETLALTRRGTPVTVRRDILDSSLIITFGAISHHYFAGYGGGRKMLFPGLAARHAIYHNHSLFLDKATRRLSPGCQPGSLEGNPLAEDLAEVDSYMPRKISIHGIMNASGNVCRLMVGSSYADFEKACAIHDGFYRYGDKKQYDLVVASGGGYPKDINFIQAHKSVHHAAAFVKDGGKLVMMLECVDGIGSDFFMQYLRAGSFEAAFSMLETNYEGNGGTALSMMEKTRRIKIYMLTSLSEEECSTLGVTSLTSPEDIRKLICEEKGTMAVIKNASILVK